ncbi:DUF4760 domain-containing protein [Vitreoscilla stercoraria]|uniref:DUF4760 domain-containing protein n=1 Tax=Vitreoscilla stercoraria TaxID=61 RepID=A0ABY4E9I2_VITST|nr:DUF4760 domain-containing protein [Vitreoscilla stercoraria]UOO92416.1 DUF4760 domain-containing protein [Vitreoscilla stercoraria]
MSPLNLLVLNVLKTFALFIPYFTILIWFYFKRDSFFLKNRIEIQFNLIISFLITAFIQIAIWNLLSLFKQESFLGFTPSSSNSNTDSSPILVLLGILAGVIGWLYNSRYNGITARRNHSIQALISSRLSTEYIQNSNRVSHISNKYSTLNPSFKNKMDISYFEALPTEDQKSIHYMLNFLEFIAVGIRFGDLDEALMKNTLSSILKNNFLLFEDIIKKYQQKNTHTFEHLTHLYNRWHC